MAWTPKQKKAHSARMKAMWDKKKKESTGIPFYGPPLCDLLVEDHALIQGYESLDYVLRRAYNQAAIGKGKDRHAGTLPFTAQPMQSISTLLGSHNGLLYQAMKKIQESNRLPHDRAINELLGAINYIAGAIIYLEANNADD